MAYIIEKKNNMNKFPHKNFIEFINDFTYDEKSLFIGKNTFSDIMIEERNTPLSPFVPFQIRVKSKLRFGYKLPKGEEYLLNNAKIHAIYEYLQTRIPSKHYKKSVIGITKQIRDRIKNGYDSFCIVDIKDYFGTIDHEILLKKIKEFDQELVIVYVKNYLNTFKSSSGKKCGLPFGVDLSHILAEIFLMNFDSQLRKYCITNDIYFYRYCDDILLLSKSSNSLEKSSKYIYNLLGNIFLITNKKKEKMGRLSMGGLLDDDNFTYLGYQHFKNILSVDPNSLRYLKKTFSKYAFSKPFGFLKNIPDYIVGYNSKWKVTDDYFAPPYGITPFYCLVNDGSEIQFERWLWKLITYCKSKAKKMFNDGDYYPITQEDAEAILNLKYPSFRKWFYKYKKNFFRTHMEACSRDYTTKLGHPLQYISHILKMGYSFTYKDLMSCVNNDIDWFNKLERKDSLIAMWRKMQREKIERVERLQDSFVSYDDISGDGDLAESWVEENIRDLWTYGTTF